MRANFRYIRKLRRMLSIAHGRKKTRFIKQLVSVMKELGKKLQRNFEDKIKAFCATLIQKIWRGYFFRRAVMRAKAREYRNRRMMRALVQGWKTRAILTRTRDCLALRREIATLA